MNEYGAATLLLGRLERDLSDAARAALDACRRICEIRGLALFLVGGAVRDLQLDRSHIDLDLAIEGAVTLVAESLAAELAGKAVNHARFGTATVSGPGFHLDLAQTRRETYAHPGALPTVEPVASILDDLSRRDFTINAMALQLTPTVRLIDPHGGLGDLNARLVRVLHEASFRDDATRMLRAARYATRLGFAIEPLTEAWLRRDLAYVDAISGARLRRELTLIFREATAPEATLHAGELGILQAVDTGLHLHARVAARWREALGKHRQAPLDELGFCLTVNPKTRDDVEAVTRRLHLTAREQKALAGLVRLRDLSDKLESVSDLPSRAVELLDGHAKASVWAMTVLDESRAARACERYLETWQHVRPQLSGNDLLALGVPQSEAVGALLKRLRQARLDGEVTDGGGEIRIVRAELGAKGGGENG